MRSLLHSAQLSSRPVRRTPQCQLFSSSRRLHHSNCHRRDTLPALGRARIHRYDIIGFFIYPLSLTRLKHLIGRGRAGGRTQVRSKTNPDKVAFVTRQKREDGRLRSLSQQPDNCSGLKQWHPLGPSRDKGAEKRGYKARCTTQVACLFAHHLSLYMVEYIPVWLHIYFPICTIVTRYFFCFCRKIIDPDCGETGESGVGEHCTVLSAGNESLSMANGSVVQLARPPQLSN